MTNSSGFGGGLLADAFCTHTSKYFCVTISFWHMSAFMTLTVIFIWSVMSNEQSFCQSLTKWQPSWVSSFLIFFLLSSYKFVMATIWGVFLKLYRRIFHLYIWMFYSRIRAEINSNLHVNWLIIPEAKEIVCFYSFKAFHFLVVDKCATLWVVCEYDAGHFFGIWL